MNISKYSLLVMIYVHSRPKIQLDFRTWPGITYPRHRMPILLYGPLTKPTRDGIELLCFVGG